MDKKIIEWLRDKKELCENAIENSKKRQEYLEKELEAVNKLLDQEERRPDNPQTACQG